MITNLTWSQEKLRKRAEREQRQFSRMMASPISRSEVAVAIDSHENHIASLALAIEVLETILIERDVLQPDQLMARMRALAEQKLEQAEAALAAAGARSPTSGAEQLLTQFRDYAPAANTGGTDGRT